MKEISLKKIYRYIVTGFFMEVFSERRKLRYEDNIEINLSNVNKLNKIAVYTTVFGNYDEIKNPNYISKNIDYFIITDQNIPKDLVWKKIDFTNPYFEKLDKKDKSRFVKIFPNLVLKNYEWSVYIDGNIKILDDINKLVVKVSQENKFIGLFNHFARDCVYEEGRVVYARGKAKYIEIFKQLNKYKKEGFPKHFGLFENNIIIRKHNEKKCVFLMEQWWNEYIKGVKRDQLSLCYVLWKNGYTANDVSIIGKNSRNNNYFEIDNHSCK